MDILVTEIEKGKERIIIEIMQVSVKISPSIHDITSTTYVRYLRLHVNLYEHGSTRITPSFPALRLQTKNLVLT